MRDQRCEGAVELGCGLTQRTRSERRWRNIIKHRLGAWDRGIGDVLGSNPAVRWDPLMQEAGFSGHDKPPPAPPTAQSPPRPRRPGSPRVRKRKGEPR
ncbi:MAG: hypothetical protein ACP5PN_11845 [Steroidobacteraceae bacterium]